MREQQDKKQWYEISIGWQEGKSWFLVDALPDEWLTVALSPCGPRQEFVEVKTTNGEISQITIQAKYAWRPTVADAIKTVLQQTHMDHSREIYAALVGLDSGKQP